MKLITVLTVYFICFVGMTVMLNEKDTFEIISSSPLVQPVLSENSLYSYYNSLERPQTLNYMIYVLDELDDDFVGLYTKEKLMKKEFEDNSYIPFYIAEIVRQIPYSKDEEGIEYPRYPIETIIDNEGDCEDKAILCASMLKSLGYKVCLFRFDTHMSIGVLLDNVSYTYIDPTNYVTERNVDLLHESYTMFTEDSPILLHEWSDAYITYTLFEKTLTLSIYMENRGINDEDFTFSIDMYNDKYHFSREKTMHIKKGESLSFQSVSVIPFMLGGTIETKILVDSIIVDERGGFV